METETQIAKENVKNYNYWEGYERIEKVSDEVCKTHLASCQRFLEFLEKIDGRLADVLKDGIGEIEKSVWKEIHGKFIIKKHKDLQQAIKTYEEAGLK